MRKQEKRQPLLQIRDLHVEFPSDDGVVRAVDGVSFDIAPGEIVGLVGESGCGKTVTTKAILGLIPPPGRVTLGDIRFKGVSLLKCSPEELRRLRGSQISIVVQDALAALNPVIPIGEQIADVLQSHTDLSWAAAWQRSLDMLRRVGMPEPERRARHFAHELSGGMQQRTVIAAALIGEPDLIIADEPTTALDVTVQQQILSLMLQARAETGSAILYISHDIATVQRFCERVIIMYAGAIVEESRTTDLFREPKHPYTQGLIGSVPTLVTDPDEFLHAIPGMPPNPAHLPIGCRFADRCPIVRDACRTGLPELIQIAAGHQVRCIEYLENAS